MAEVWTAIAKAPESIESSVRELLRVVLTDRHRLDWIQREENGTDVLLDVEVDGVRCLLQRRPPSSPLRPVKLLTPREEEIAEMVAQGYPNKAIASLLEISSWTVSSHLRRMYAKLGVSSRAAMVARLLEDRP
ncbi:MAG: response regulator transcription factor [Egibacteraceae bacterium]